MAVNKNIRTDLTLEAHEILKEEQVKASSKKEPDDGIVVENEGDDQVIVTRVRIINKKGEQKIGKPMGTYITIEIPELRANKHLLYEKTIKILKNELTRLLGKVQGSTILVVGLGNWNITPDSLGPKVLSKVLVTRHLHEYVPEELEEGLNPVCGLSPGVLGITGIETGEIIFGVKERVKPDVIIAIDALASRKLSRVNTTIQLADTGISPGSGVGNQRMELSSQTLGIPVIAIGVPTVVDAATMANDTINLVLDEVIKSAKTGTQFYNMLKELSEDEKYDIIHQVLEPFGNNMIVTPKEIDTSIETISKIIAEGINKSLHKGYSKKIAEKYLS